MKLGMIGLGRMGSNIASRGEWDFANRLLSALRFEFGGHEEKRG